MDYSFDDQHRLIHFKYDLAPQVLAKLSRTLPELLMHDGLVTCSFEWRNHPECEKLKTLAGEWARIHFAGDIINISCDKLIGSDFDLLATMTMARCRSERMPAAVKLMVWFFAFDNFVDEPAHMGADLQASQEMMDAVMNVFHNVVAVEEVGIIKNGDKPEIVGPMKGGNSVYGSAIRVIRESACDWWNEMRQLGMSMRQQYRFVSVFKRYLDANTEQVAFRQLRHIPDLDTYKELRLHTSGCYVCSMMLEFALGLDLADEIIEHPLLVALNVAAFSHVMFVNDIFSFRKELSDGDLMNIVPILLWQNLGISHQQIVALRDVEPLVRETISQALALVRELDEECVRLMAKIQVAVRGGSEVGEGEVLAEEEAAAAVERYMDGVSDWMSGNVQWHHISKRYVQNNNNPSISI